MGLHWIDWTIIAAFLLMSLLIGLYFRKRASKSLLSFFLGDRDMPWLIAGISMVATTFAADTPLAVTELVGQSGISGNWLWWSFLAGGMLTTFFFAKLWRRAGVLTEIELIELRYGGQAAKILRAFKSVYLGLFMNVLIIGWVNLAMMSILQEFFGLETSTVYIVLAFAMTLAAVYTSLSGIWGVAVTDVVQFCVAITGTIILAVIVVNRPEVGGISGLKAALPPESFDFFPSLTSGELNIQTLSISIGAFLAYVGVQWWSSWYPGQEPGGGGYVAQRMMSTRTEKGAVYATLLFQIAHYCLRPWPWIIVALSCLVLYPQVNPMENPEITAGAFGKTYVWAMRDFLPVGLKGLLLASFLAAYLSTISTQLNWGAGYLVNDLYKRFISPKMSEKGYVKASRWVTFLLMICGLSATTLMDSISGVWSFIMECGAGLGLVLILRWYWWRINAWSEITATIAPFFAFGFSKLVGWEFPQSFFFTVGFTTVAWIVVTFLTQPEQTAVLRKFYDRVQPDGNWKIFTKDAKKANNMGPLFVCWITSVTLAYSFLFMTGKILFMEWKEAVIFAVVCLVSGIVFIRSLKHTSIWR